MKTIYANLFAPKCPLLTLERNVIGGENFSSNFLMASGNVEPES